jgi:hypothetical protein
MIGREVLGHFPIEVGMPRRGVRQSSRRDDPTVDGPIWGINECNALHFERYFDDNLESESEPNTCDARNHSKKENP